jgi:uncharacterized protein GlcG (DUF336 family)
MSFKTAIQAIAATMLAAVSVGVAAQAPLPYGAPISIDNAKKAAAGAIAEAHKLKAAYVIAITDPAGILIYLEKMDNTSNGSVAVAIGKARSAAQFRRPTSSFQDRLKSGDTYLLSLEGAVLVGGGVPIVMDSKIVGAVGSSGGSAEQDNTVSQGGANAVK